MSLLCSPQDSLKQPNQGTVFEEVRVPVGVLRNCSARLTGFFRLHRPQDFDLTLGEGLCAHSTECCKDRIELLIEPEALLSVFQSRHAQTERCEDCGLCLSSAEVGHTIQP